MCKWFQVVDSSLRKLESDPTEIEEFLEHFTFLGAVSSKITELEKEYSTVAQLYSVLRYYQIHISEEQVAIYKILLLKFGQLKTAMKLSDTNKDAAIIKFRDNLEAYITSLRVDISNLKTKVSFCFSLKISLILVSYKPKHIGIFFVRNLR